MGYFIIVFVRFFFQLVKRRIWAFGNINTMFYFRVWLLRMGREELREWPEEPILIGRLWVFLSHVLLGAICKRQTPLCDPTGRGKRIVHFSKGLVADLPGMMTNSSPLTQDCTPRALSSARGKWYQERKDKLKRAHTNLSVRTLFIAVWLRNTQGKFCKTEDGINVWPSLPSRLIDK